MHCLRHFPWAFQVPLIQLQSSLDDIQTELFNLMKTDSLPRFLISPQFKKFIEKVPVGRKPFNLERSSFIALCWNVMVM